MKPKVEIFIAYEKLMKHNFVCMAKKTDEPQSKILMGCENLMKYKIVF